MKGNNIAVVLGILIVVAIGLVTFGAYLSQPGSSATLTSTGASAQTAYTVTGTIQCATFNFTFSSGSASSASSPLTFKAVAPVSMSVRKGDGVCLDLYVYNSTVTGYSIAVPRSFLLANLPPQYKWQMEGDIVNYTSNVTYSGPVRFTFLFGASQTGNYQTTVSLDGYVQAKVDVTVGE
jgi:hypothetical protein